MTRADRATFRPEFAARFARLLEVAGGRRALEAQGALALLWHVHATASGFIPLRADEAAGVLGVDARTWRALARALVEAGLLEVHDHGYAVPDAGALEGTTTARGTAGYLRTHRPTYGGLVERVQRAGVLEHRRGAYTLAALGLLEVLRTSHANWSTGVARWSTAAAGRELALGARTIAGYLLLLEHALVLERTGTRVRVLGWRTLTFGPPWRRPAEVLEAHNVHGSVDGQVHNSTDSSVPKSRAEVTNLPLPPASATPALGELHARRGEHEHLPQLLQALAERLPAAGFAAWRRPVRAQLSHALAAARGDVAGLADELLRRPFTNANDVPSVLAYRCAGAVEVVRSRQASHAAAERLRAARAEQRAVDHAADAALHDEQARGQHVVDVAGELWPAVLDTVAAGLPWATRPGTPGHTAGRQRMLEATVRTRVLEHADELARAGWGLTGHGGRSSTGHSWRGWSARRRDPTRPGGAARCSAAASRSPARRTS